MAATAKTATKCCAFCTIIVGFFMLNWMKLFIYEHFNDEQNQKSCRNNSTRRFVFFSNANFLIQNLVLTMITTVDEACNSLGPLNVWPKEHSKSLMRYCNHARCQCLAQQQTRVSIIFSSVWIFFSAYDFIG